MTTPPENDLAAGGDGKTAADRRKQPRFVADVPVRLTAAGASFAGFLCDVCRDAAWVESERGCALGEQVAIAVELPGTGGPMIIPGHVARVGPGERASNGMAILFDDLPPMVATRIEFFVALQGY